VTISRAAPAGRSGARAFAHQEPYRAPVSADPSEGTEPHTPQERPEEPRLELEPHASIPCHLAARFLAHFGRRECCGRGGRRRSLPASRPAVWRVAQTGGANGPRGGRFDARGPPISAAFQGSAITNGDDPAPSAEMPSGVRARDLDVPARTLSFSQGAPRHLRRADRAVATDRVIHGEAAGKRETRGKRPLSVTASLALSHLQTRPSATEPGRTRNRYAGFVAARENA
jgi:hypothetical protein